MKKNIFYLSFLLAFLFVACAKMPEQATRYEGKKELAKSRYDSSTNKGKAPDFIDPKISQNADELAFFPYKIKLDENRYLDRVFRTWSDALPSKKNASQVFVRYKSGYDKNAKPHSKKWLKELEKNANKNDFGKVASKAVTTDVTAIRTMPTNENIFPDGKSARQNNFDDLSQSVLGAFSPVMVSHFSSDKKWAFVRTDGFWGWCEAKNIMLLSEAEARAYKELSFGVFIKDNESIEGFKSRIGGIFPYSFEDKKEFRFKGKIGAKNLEFRVPKSVGSHFLALNDKNLKSLANELIGQKYGWGGMRGLRDCSLFTKDFFAVFARWLPRNSQPQGAVNGKINLENLSPEQKKRVLNEKGVALASLIVMPGHIMLYAGGNEVIHNVWGVRTKENGRSIVGKTAITDLELGKGYENVDNKALWISRIKGINVIVDPKKIAFEHAYNVTINSKIRFDDGFLMDYNDDEMMSFDYAIYAPLTAAKSDASKAVNYEFFAHIYGANEEEVKANLTKVAWLKSSLNKEVEFNTKNGAARALQNVSDELNKMSKKNAGLLKFLEVEGIDEWGIALNLGKDAAPKEVVEVFETHGFIWGGRWQEAKPNHFVYRPEYMMFERLLAKN